jgi:hypothetical protein
MDVKRAGYDVSLMILLEKGRQSQHALLKNFAQ